MGSEIFRVLGVRKFGRVRSLFCIDSCSACSLLAVFVLVWTSAVSFGEVAIKTHDLKARRVIVFFQPSVDTAALDSQRMLTPAAINVVDRQEFDNRFATADASRTVVFGEGNVSQGTTGNGVLVFAVRAANGLAVQRAVAGIATTFDLPRLTPLLMPPTILLQTSFAAHASFKTLSAAGDAQAESPIFGAAGHVDNLAGFFSISTVQRREL
jgi:hypothetical protein